MDNRNKLLTWLDSHTLKKVASSQGLVKQARSKPLGKEESCARAPPKVVSRIINPWIITPKQKKNAIFLMVKHGKSTHYLSELERVNI